MFNVTRITEVPTCCENKTDYKSEDVLKKLNFMFHGKCYICETKNLQSPRVEHRVPHRGNVNLKFDWNNLFLSCERCNSIKSDDFPETIDCCSSIKINDLIFIKLEYVPCWKIIAYNKVNNPSVEVLSTIELINKCCNEDNTPIRMLSKQTLKNDINEAQCLFIQHKIKIMKGNDPDDEIEKSKNFIKNMANPKYPFSAIWHGMIDCDQDLKDRLNS